MKQKGFTLIEAITVTFLVVTLMGISLANFAGIRRSANLESDANLLLIEVRKAQAEALSPQRDSGKYSGLTDLDKLCAIGVEVDGEVIQPKYRSVTDGFECNNTVPSENWGPSFTLEHSSVVGPYSIFFNTPFATLSKDDLPFDTDGSGALEDFKIEMTSQQDMSLTRSLVIQPSGIISIR